VSQHNVISNLQCFYTCKSIAVKWGQ